jgi:hypothetical protein
MQILNLAVLAAMAQQLPRLHLALVARVSGAVAAVVLADTIAQLLQLLPGALAGHRALMLRVVAVQLVLMVLHQRLAVLDCHVIRRVAAAVAVVVERQSRQARRVQRAATAGKVVAVVAAVVSA